jgi:exonuclease SbcC
MIPVSLRMRNFMPYRGDTPPLSFTSIHTACISGDNGAGKSSIIDAITWALWGRSRAKSDDDLIHQGENETQVEFDFSSGGQLYRVIRKHARPKGKKASGQSSLDFFRNTGGCFVPDSGDSIRQTQEKIESTLHMDYDTFTNSAYLRQGHADEFTRKEPGKRKEVLANILGLSIYDEYEDRAKEKAKEAEQAKLQLSAGISEIEAGLAQRPVCDVELKQVEVTSTEIDASVSQKETGLKQLRSEVQALEGVRTQLAQLDAAIKRHNEDFRREEERLKQSTVHVVEYQKLLDGRTAIESGYQELQKVRKLHDEMNQQARQSSRMNERKNQYEKARDRAQSDLNTQHKLIENNIQQLDARAVKLPELKLEQQKLLPVQRALVSLEAEIKSKREESLDKKEELSRLAAGISRLKQDVTEIDEKLGLLSETSGGAHCPLCETDLGNEKLELVESKYACEKQEKLTSIKRNEGDSISLSAEIKSLDAEINRLEARQKQESYAFTSQESRITQTIKEAAEASSSLEGERQKLAQVEETMATQDYARAEQEAIARIEVEMASLAYDEKKHDALQQEVERLKPCEEQKRRLDEALKLVAQEKENAARSAEVIADINMRLAADSQSQKQLATQLSALPEISQKLALAEVGFKRLAEEQKFARERLVVLREQIKRLAELEKRSTEKRKSLAEATEKESIYKQLAQIFGKKGIQAMLIETALPEIEAEANRLLSRMTDGRMSLTIEPQKITKKGDISETLDIKIADELGTRNYEMFSGGEAFRIDFAIRIALSRLLARRAGAPLPTLIIDEGFGTQDADGIEKLKEAINSVQDDFQKILVITHIDELKDAFPTRIDVVKKADGSTIEVS